MREFSVSPVVFAAFGVTVLVAWLATRWLVTHLRRRGMLDQPNERSSHKVPTPRGGGLGLIVGLAAGWAVLAGFGEALPPWPILVGAVLIALIGFLDDRIGDINPLWRFGGQAGVAAMVAFSGLRLEAFPLPSPAGFETGWFSIPLTIVWITGVVNFYNFLDGIDGYAGAQAVLAGGALFVLGAGAAADNSALLVAGASAGFLIHNWQPAMIFMGDVGSTTLGFLLATIPLAAPTPERSTTVFAMAMFLWFFLADGLYTMARRTIQGEKPWTSHRSHLYQLWTQAGHSHEGVVVRVMLMAVPLSLLTVAAVVRKDLFLQWVAAGLAVGLFILYWRLAANPKDGEDEPAVRLPN